MVHRRLTALLAACLGFAAALATTVGAPEPAAAANARVAIANYLWTPKEIEIDLGEHVTWYWTGPDTMHSVTGISDNAKGIDTDPSSRLPSHDLGDTFQYTFNRPGTYRFQCKLHTLVGGSVTVSNRPGDPISEPDPVPKINVDRSKPVLSDVRLASKRFGRKGASMRFSLNDRGKLDAEYFRYEPKRKGKRKRNRNGDRKGNRKAKDDRKGRGKQGRRKRGGGPRVKREFAGWDRWRVHIGWNHVRLGDRSKHFKPRPGRYVAVLRAIDQTANESKPKRIRFTIRRR